MRVLPSVACIAMLSMGLLAATSAQAFTGEEGQLIESINAYRSQAQRCGDAGSLELPPLSSDTRLALSPEGTRDLQQAMTRAAYLMVNVQAISLSGPRDAKAAMHAISESFCQVVLDPQFVDIGVSQEGRDWRIVLARPLLSGRLGDWQAEGQKLLQEINAARKLPRQCAGQPFAAAPALAWNTTLAGVAASHTRAMASRTSSTISTAMAAPQAIAPSWPATCTGRLARTLPPGVTPRARWSMAGWPALGIARR